MMEEIGEKDEVFEVRERLNSLRQQNTVRANKNFKRGESQSTIRMHSYQPTIITEIRRKTTHMKMTYTGIRPQLNSTYLWTTVNISYI